MVLKKLLKSETPFNICRYPVKISMLNVKKRKSIKYLHNLYSTCGHLTSYCPEHLIFFIWLIAFKGF